MAPLMVSAPAPLTVKVRPVAGVSERYTLPEIVVVLVLLNPLLSTAPAELRMMLPAPAIEPTACWKLLLKVAPLATTRAELIATGLGVDEICRGIGADSLGYISLEGMVAATEQPIERLCTACFTGKYPIPLPDPTLLGKHNLEQGLLFTTDVEGVTTGVSGGAQDALSRP